ncbi:MAG: hypothetical protein LBU88_00325 [Treponema sp.]|jgi:hypothetical protein|nr:hypothetical protein [Treponema sp.]
MNMNIDLVNRALYTTGHEELISKEDRSDEKKKPMYNLCKAFYLSTYLEALSEVPWVSARRRKRLMRVRRPRFRSGYRFVYTLPYDCARAVELSGKGDYIIEGRYLCTDEKRAELMYITNGKRLPRLRIAQAPAPGEEADIVLSPGEVDESDIPVDVVFDPGEPEEDGIGKEECLECGELLDHCTCKPEEDDNGIDTMDWDELDEAEADDLDEGDIYEEDELDEGDIVEDTDEDYPEYELPQYEPKFYEYIEMSLAAKFAIKITDKPQLSSMLFQKAQFIKDQAITASKSMAKAKKQHHEWWDEQRKGF